MTRQSKLIILVAYLLILSVVMFSYRTNRSKKVKLIRAELSRVESEKNKVRRDENELARISRLIPSEADSTAVVEALYRFAKESGLTQHNVKTEVNKKLTSARNRRSSNNLTVAANRINVNTIGSFRQTAEYIRRLQNMERFNRIAELRLTPSENVVKASLTVEVFSLPVN
ncbi:MAG: hypothetical protein PHN84_01695 [Desulfuromonadaceae bacterium]|nr:hypothetical protein [Desulfuromonadaceae bacterium]MDD2854930.1 hypothetical protein [Desulfuromonadaceae bacterium]